MQLNPFSTAASFPGCPSEWSADYIASTASRFKLSGPLPVTVPDQPSIGDVVVVRVKKVNAGYPTLELPDGSEAHLRPGDILVGVLGIRKAMHGFSGKLPLRLETGTLVHLLNKGGVVGECTAFHRDLGWPSVVEYLGTVAGEHHPLNLKDGALPIVEGPLPQVPVVVVMGTCMNAGKTTVCSRILENFSRQNFRVHAGKVAGVACQRDVLKMKESGATEILSFHDFGLPSTAGVESIAPVARSMVHHLAQGSPDFILLEMGDGILGGYQVASLLSDAEFMNQSLFMVLCANDLMGVWGGLHWMRQHGIRPGDEPPLLISGPVTDSGEGIHYIEENWKIPAANAFDSGGKICSHLFKSLMPWLAVH